VPAVNGGVPAVNGGLPAVSVLEMAVFLDCTLEEIGCFWKPGRFPVAVTVAVAVAVAIAAAVTSVLSLVQPVCMRLGIGSEQESSMCLLNGGDGKGRRMKVDHG